MPETEDELLEATGRVLAREGYADLTTQKVATEANVSHPAVHYHFDTKEGLLVAFVENYTDDWIDRLDEIEGDDAGERLANVLSMFVEVLADPDQAAYSRALMELHTRAPHVEPLREALARLDRETIEFVAELIDTGVEEGVFRGVDAETTAELLLCAVDGATIRQHALDGDASTVLSDGLARHVLTDLYAGDVPSLGDVS